MARFQLFARLIVCLSRIPRAPARSAGLDCFSLPRVNESKPCFAEDGHIEPACEFDYDAIDRGSFGAEQPSDEHMDGAKRAFTQLVEWVWQSGMNNADGIAIRAIIVCWIFLPELRPLSLTEMAQGFDKHKQSLGRWVDIFKRDFPHIRIAHMKE